MEVWQIIGFGLAVAVGGIAGVARIIYVSRFDPWWGKAVSGLLALALGLITTFTVTLAVAVYYNIGYPLPQPTTEQPPTVWWR